MMPGATNLKKERERWEKKGIFFKVALGLFFGENKTRRRKKRALPHPTLFTLLCLIPGRVLMSFPVAA